MKAIGSTELQAELVRFERHSKLLSGSVHFAVIAGIATALLIILALSGALANINVEILVALLYEPAPFPNPPRSPPI